MLNRRHALLFFKVIYQILRLHEQKHSRFESNFKEDYSVLSIYIAVVYIADLDISRSHVGPHFLAHLFREFCRRGAQERDIFREIAVTPCIQFAGDNFREICSPRKLLFPFAEVKFSRNQLEPTCQCGLEHMLCDGQPL